MEHKNRVVAQLLRDLDLGSSVAETDSLLETARVETSAFNDLLNDRVDLVPGTKGSGKSSLFRIVVEFLPDHLLEKRKIVVAHGVQAPGDPVFHAFADQFKVLTEEEFVSFWCIYLVSLAHEQFIKSPKFGVLLSTASKEMQEFRIACEKAKIPEIRATKSLKDILAWALHVLATWRPKLRYKLPESLGAVELDLFGTPTEDQAAQKQPGNADSLPSYVNEIKEALERVLIKSNLSLWLMVDRLDEIFPRRSDVERSALRGLLRAMRFFSSSSIRVKIFLRDDMLDNIVHSDEGFTALTHVTARQADTLCWTEDQILTMIINRICANDQIAKYLKWDSSKAKVSAEYRSECFKKIFPEQVFKGTSQSSTLRWIYKRCADGRGVVTPRDVLQLLIRAKQRQEDLCAADLDGVTEAIIGSAAIQHGLQELSKLKRQTYLQAEFPHLWSSIAKFVGGKTDYSETAIKTLLGNDWQSVSEDLVALGVLSKKGHNFNVPFLYRDGLELTQGKA